MKNILLYVSLCIGLLFFAFGIADLSNYGVNWDEPIHFGRGQAILYYFLTGKTNYKDFDYSDRKRSYYQIDAYSYDFFENEFRFPDERIIGSGHPPLSDVFAALSNYILYQKFNVLGDIESYHFYSVFVAALLVGSICYFVGRHYGLFAGIFSALSLSLFPFFLGESRFNIKDIPETVFYSFTLLSFYKGLVDNKVRWIFISSVFFAFALGTKLNILFLGFTLMLWLAIYLYSLMKRKKLQAFLISRNRIFFSYLFYPIIGIIIFVGIWPLLWSDPFVRGKTVIDFYKTIGITSGFDPRFLFLGVINLYPIIWVVTTVPLIIFFFFLIGIIYFIKNYKYEHDKFLLLVFFWFLIPIVRVSHSHAAIYGGIRQIMEYIPPMTIFAGIGASYSVRLVHKYVSKCSFKLINIPTNIILQLLVLLSFTPIVLKIVSMYPNESIYFNPLIGGLQGARDRNLPGWGNSLGSTYRQGTKWLNANSEPNAKIGFVFELLSNIPFSELRDDLLLYNQVRSGLDQKGEYIIGVTHNGSYEDSFHRKYLERFLDPVYQVVVDDVPVLKVWKNDKEHTKESYNKQQEKHIDYRVEKKDRVVIVDLMEIVRVTKIEILFDPLGCFLPENGYFELSVNGELWKKAYGDFARFPLTVYTKPQPKPGVLQFWFPAERARYVQMVIYDENSCLQKKDLQITIYKI